MILQLVLHNNHNIFMALQSSCGCNILHEVIERRSPSCSNTCNDHVQHQATARTTSPATSPSSTSTWSLASWCLPALPALARCAFDGTLRSTSPSRCSCSSASRRFDRCPSCPSSSTTTSTRCARWRLLHWPHRPLQQMRERGRASPANVKSGWPGPIPKCHACIGPPHRPRPARTCARTIARTIARTTARTHAHARPQTWPGAFAQMSARFHPRYACMRVRYGG